MNNKQRNIFISLGITAVLGIFIFFINDPNQEFGPSFGAYVKLQFVWITGLIGGAFALLAAIIFRTQKKRHYTDKLFYIFPGILNLLIGLYGIGWFLFHRQDVAFAHEAQPNLLLGV